MNGKKALLVIDAQLDYFPGYKYPQWNTQMILANLIKAIVGAQNHDIPVILIQHIAEGAMAPFFLYGSLGSQLHPSIHAEAVESPVVVKHYADSFEKTTLEDHLRELMVTELLICGMMTQNCVTFTALSKKAEKYNPVVLTDCCTSVSEMIHLIALNALSTRVKLQELSASGLL